MMNLRRIDLGIEVDRLVYFSIMPKLSRYTDRQVAQFHEQMMDRLGAIPGVTLVSASQLPAVDGNRGMARISVEGFTPEGAEEERSAANAVGADYFRTMGMRLMAGRDFRRSDIAGARKVAVVNEAFAKKFLAGRNPLGRRMAMEAGVPPDKLDIEIAGVVKDAKYASVTEKNGPVFFVAVAQNERWFQLYYYLRTSLRPEDLFQRVRSEIASIDPSLPFRRFQTFQRQLDENMYRERTVSFLTSAFAGLATLLAAVGLYGVLAYNIARRTREIGIRMALGAAAGAVRGMVLREVVVMLGIGTVLGVAAAAACGKLVESQLYGIEPWDRVVYTSAVGLLWAVALVAAYVPVRRATRVDPLIALRHE